MNTTKYTPKKYSNVYDISSLERAKKHNDYVLQKRIWKQNRISKMQSKIEKLKTEISKLEAAIYHEEKPEADVKAYPYDLESVHDYDGQKVEIPMDRVERVGRYDRTTAYKINGKWHIIRGMQNKEDEGTFNNIEWKLREISEEELYTEI